MRITTLSKKDELIENLYTVHGVEIKTSDGGMLRVIEKDGAIYLKMTSLRVVFCHEDFIHLSLIDEFDN